MATIFRELSDHPSYVKTVQMIFENSAKICENSAKICENSANEM